MPNEQGIDLLDCIPPSHQGTVAAHAGSKAPDWHRLCVDRAEYRELLTIPCVPGGRAQQSSVNGVQQLFVDTWHRITTHAPIPRPDCSSGTSSKLPGHQKASSFRERVVAGSLKHNEWA